MEERDDVNIKVFNAAKVFAEKILFSKMESYQKFQRQADFGCENLDDSWVMSEEIRDINRFNGLKGMNDTVHNLLIDIASTVRLHKKKDEIDQLDKLIDLTKKVKVLFHDRKENFFRTIYKNMKTIELLDRDYFENIKDIVDTIYINTTVLMTRNKLLFNDSGDEYQSDEQIKEDIMKEYVEG